MAAAPTSRLADEQCMDAAPDRAFWQEYHDLAFRLLGERDAVLADAAQLREALAGLLAWQPQLPGIALDSLHPQHQEAIRAARGVLAGASGE